MILDQIRSSGEIFRALRGVGQPRQDHVWIVVAPSRLGLRVRILFSYQCTC